MNDSELVLILPRSLSPPFSFNANAVNYSTTRRASEAVARPIQIRFHTRELESERESASQTLRAREKGRQVATSFRLAAKIRHPRANLPRRKFEHELDRITRELTTASDIGWIGSIDRGLEIAPAKINQCRPSVRSSKRNQFDRRASGFLGGERASGEKDETKRKAFSSLSVARFLERARILLHVKSARS